MIRAPFKVHVQAGLARDRIDDPERQAETLEHGTLLDMKLDVSNCVITRTRFADSAGIQSKRADRGGDFREQLSVYIANERAAADERYGKSHAFFFRESDHFNRKRPMASAKALDQCHSEHDAQDSVERPSARNRIQM